MRTRTGSDVIAAFIAWTPLCAFVVLAGWLLMVGVIKLEQNSYGTTYFTKQTANENHWAGAADAIREQRQLEREALGYTVTPAPEMR